MTIADDEIRRITEVLADAVAHNQTGIITHVDLASGIDEAWLTYTTEAPSGRRYGALTRDAAMGMLESLGIRLVEHDAGELLTFSSRWSVRVEFSGTAYVTVDAADEDEARERAIEMAEPSECDITADAWSVQRLAPAEAVAS